MLICYHCLKIFEESSGLREPNRCPETNCNGIIINVKDVVAPFYISLRKKRYNFYISYNYDGSKPSIGIYFREIQYSEHLPKPPKNFTSYKFGDSYVIARKLIMTDADKRDNEITEIVEVLLEWIKIVPAICLLSAIYKLKSRSDAINLYNELIKVTDFLKLKVEELEEDQFLIKTLKIIKEDDEKDEISKIFSFKNSSAATISYELKK